MEKYKYCKIWRIFEEFVLISFLISIFNKLPQCLCSGQPDLSKALCCCFNETTPWAIRFLRFPWKHPLIMMPQYEWTHYSVILCNTLMLLFKCKFWLNDPNWIAMNSFNSFKFLCLFMCMKTLKLFQHCIMVTHFSGQTKEKALCVMWRTCSLLLFMQSSWVS